MSELISNLNKIESCKLDIKSAIEAKGVDMTGLSFSDYPSAIASIQTGGNYSQLNVTENGSYSPGTYGVDAFDNVEVLVQPSLQSKSVSINGTVTPDQGYYGLSAVVVDVPQSVTGLTEKEVTEGVQIVNLSNSASSVGPYAFAGNSYLQTVNLPNCIVVNVEAFFSCTNLQTVNLPVCESLGTTTYGNTSVFMGCTNLTNISIPVCKYVTTYAFNNCKKLVSFYGPSVSIIGQRCFEGCYSLNSVYIPLCSQIDNYGFRYCSALTSIDLPEVNWLGASVFQYCSNLSYVNIPQISSVRTGLFQNCTSLTTVLLGSLSSSVIPLENSNAFTGTPIAAGVGSIYVPASLVDAYKSATNWSVFSSHIFSIPE